MRKPIKMLFYIIVGVVSLVVAGVIGVFAYGAYTYHKYHRMTDTRDLKSRIDGQVKDYLETREHGGVVVGVLQRGQRHVRGYGRGVAPGTPPNGKTIYEIGSITKVFTGIVLAKMEQDGLVGLDDTLEKHLKDVALADALRPLTLRQLATHTAGLPALPKNFDALATDAENPYAGYRSEHLLKALADLKLEEKPGDKPLYSNVGMGLLAYVLERRAGKAYEALVMESICTPLEMRDTIITSKPGQDARLLLGHTFKGVRTKNWKFDALAGCGAFRSTADDMLLFLAANLQAPEGPVGKVLARAQEKHFKSWMENAGLGWGIEENGLGLVFHWHNGGTGGYKSFCGIDRKHQTAVILLSNYGDAFARDSSLDKIGFEILTLASKVSLE